MKYNFVYKTTNNLNGDYYYGVHSTDNLDDGYMGSGKRIKRSINKYGKENFTREIVQYFSNAKCAFSLERAIVTLELIDDPHCLNIAIGGFGGNVTAGYTEEQRKERGAKISKGNKGKCRPFSEEHKQKLRKPKSEEYKQKMREIKTGYHHSEETRKKISAGNKGRQVSEETRQKISKILKGKQVSEETRQKISKKCKGYKHTEEARRKISESHKGHSTSDITREKISKANKGRKHTEESRKHMSDGQKGKSMAEETKDKLRKSFRGRKFINNGTINKQVKESELSLFLNNGWQIGRIKN